MVSDRKNKLIKSFSLMLIVLFSMIAVPLIIGLSKGGFTAEELFSEWTFYIGPGVGFIVGIALALGIEALITKGDSKYGDSIAFASPGEVPSPPFFKRFSLTQIAWLSAIVFPAMALLNFITTGQAFTGVGTLPQQFTAFDSALFSSGLVPAAENAGLAFVITICIVGLRHLARKYKWSKNEFWGITYSIVLIGGTYGVLNHLSRYGGQELNIIVVLLFWAMGTALTLLTGTFIPFWIMHIANNFFIDISRIFSSELISIYSVITLIAFAVLYVVVYRKNGKWYKGVNS